ncbi:MAG TPA: formate/nitrite transporter family protein [Stellaceae bacterium]|nr:formate/nitrite transporter family protein [Stellaceae bacterium]
MSGAAEHNRDDESSESEDSVGGVSEREVEDVEERSRLRVPVIYEIVRREGETEMARPTVSLCWSGLAAGLSLSFSLLAQAVLHRLLPDAGWRPLVTGFGYCFGFLIVVLGRQQLFTENTVTAVLPVFAEPTLAHFRSLVRMWVVVFVANLVGTLAAAAFCTFTPVIPPELRDAMLALSGHVAAGTWVTMFFGGITSGFLIATMVWLIPSAEGTQFHVITVVTYLIAIGSFPHVIAGSMDAFMLLLGGHWGVGEMLAHFTIPVLFGNIVGGTVLFALLSYAQVMHEM